MQHRLYLSLRYLFGIAMTVFGIGNLFQLLPPHRFGGTAGEVMHAFVLSGYILQAVGFCQIVLGIALLLNRFIPLALLVFAPIVVNVVLFHLFLDMSSIAMAMPIVGLTVYFFFSHKSSFAPLFTSRP